MKRAMSKMLAHANHYMASSIEFLTKIFKYNEMKRLISIIILAFTVSALSAQPNNLMKDAERYYTANDFANAIKTYESILKQGFESSELYFNLGNSYYKNNEIAKSVLNYERAKLLAPNDEDIQFNLDLVNQFVVDKISPMPRFIVTKWWQSLINMNSADGWGRISLIFFIIMLIAAAGYIFASSVSLKKTSFIAAIVLFTFCAFSFGFGSTQKTKISNRKGAVIFSSTVTVKSSPDESGTDLFVIHEGLKVEVKEVLSGWCNIKIADGSSGWVKQSTLEKI